MVLKRLRTSVDRDNCVTLWYNICHPLVKIMQVERTQAGQACGEIEPVSWHFDRWL